MIRNLLFLHVPQNPYDKNSFIQAAPIGLIGLGTYVKENTNVNVQLCHLGDLIKNNKYKNINEFVSEKKFDMVALDLHWHFQCYSVIKTCQLLKKLENPPIIVLGGFTASYFAEEILLTYEEIDYIIKGDGEIPYIELINVLNKEKGSLSQVSNLLWKKDGHVYVNDKTFSISNKLLNDLKDWNLSIYGKESSYQGYIYGGQMGFPNFFVPVGRGCSLNCSYCAGSKENQKISNNRECVALRTPSRVCEIIENVMKYGFEHFYICFDPPEISIEWYHELFFLIREKQLNIGVAFECYSIPSEEFMEDFAKTFDMSKSRLIISPTSISDNIRKIFTAQRYSFREFELTVKKCEKLNIPLELYFSLLPCEEDKDWNQFSKKVEWIKKSNKNNISALLLPIMIEPGAPWYEHPERYNIEISLKSFKDFYEFHRKNMSEKYLGFVFHNFRNRLVYYDSILKNWISDQEIIRKIIQNDINLIYMEDINSIYFFEEKCNVSDKFKNVLVLRNKSINLLELCKSINLDLYYTTSIRLLNDKTSKTIFEITNMIDIVYSKDIKFASYNKDLLESEMINIELCKWIGNGCLASNGKSIGIDKNGKFYCCDLSGSKLKANEIKEIRKEIKNITEAIYKKRGCNNCDVNKICPKCINIENKYDYCNFYKKNQDKIIAIKKLLDYNKILIRNDVIAFAEKFYIPIDIEQYNILLLHIENHNKDILYFIYNLNKNNLHKVGKKVYFIVLIYLLQKITLEEVIKDYLHINDDSLIQKLILKLRDILE